VLQRDKKAVQMRDANDRRCAAVRRGTAGTAAQARWQSVSYACVRNGKMSRGGTASLGGAGKMKWGCASRCLAVEPCIIR